MSKEIEKTTDYEKRGTQATLRAIAHEREEKSRKLRAQLHEYREGTTRNVRRLLAEFQSNRKASVRKQTTPKSALTEEASRGKTFSFEMATGLGSVEQATLKEETTAAEPPQKSGGESLGLTDLIAIIGAGPGGIEFSTIRKQTKLPRRKLDDDLRKLVENKKIRKDRRKYFVITSDQQQKGDEA